MTAGVRGPMRVYLCSVPEKRISLSKTEHGKVFYKCPFVHRDSFDIMKYQKLHATRLRWGVGWGAVGSVDAKKVFNV